MFTQENRKDIKDSVLFNALEITKMPMVLSDPSLPDNPIVFANSAFLAMTGYDAEDVLDRNCRFLQGPDTDPETVRRIQDGIKNKQPVNAEILNYKKDGSPFWNALFIAPVFDDNNELVYFFASQVDVSDRYKSENLLARQTLDRNRLWNISRDILLVADFDGIISSVNPAWTTILGWSEEELVNRPYIDFIHEDDREDSLGAADQLEEGVSFERFYNRYRHKDGSYRNICWTAIPGNDFVTAIGRDITIDMQQAEALRQTEEILQQSQKMEAVGQLTGGISHDFNNLLTIVQGYSELLLINLDSDNFNIERAKRSVNAILEAVDKGATLNKQLMSFSRKKKAEGQIVNIHNLIDKLEPLIAQSVGEGIEIEVVHKGSGCCSKIDPVQTETALINVAVNARDAMKGHGKLAITTQSLTIEEPHSVYGQINPGEYLAVSIADNGSGMPPDVLTKITEPFFTTKSEGQGTGLGMSMVYGFIKQSDGVLKIESEVGQGTTVHMLFPKEHGGSDEHPTLTIERVVAEKHSHDTSILVVEDKNQVADYVDHMLSEFGYTVLRAANAAQAMDLLVDDQKIDILFTDIKMPGQMNGVQLARLVQSNFPDVKILLTSGHADETFDITDNQGGNFDIIRKPYRQSDLINKLKFLHPR